MNPICYRNRIDIITSILKIANGNEVKQVEILVKANITHTMNPILIYSYFKGNYEYHLRIPKLESTNEIFL